MLTEEELKEQPLHVKYRPQTLDEVIGQEHVINSLKSLFKEENLPHAFLFSGPSGTGKTSLARIIANHLNCNDYNIMEIDAATHTGVDDMRALTEDIRYKGLGLNPLKLIILDECHMLSRNAWNSLLKAVEEPPKHVYFAFCTTEVNKVPETIQTRCLPYTLELLSKKKILEVLDHVIKSEAIEIADIIKRLIAYASKGSPRKALVFLSQVKDLPDPKEVVRLILKEELEIQRSEGICKLLLSQAEWKEIVAIHKTFSSEGDYNSIRHQIVKYFYKSLMKVDTLKELKFFSQIIGEFMPPLSSGTERNELLYRLSKVHLMIVEQENSKTEVPPPK